MSRDPLPRLHAVATRQILELPDFVARAQAIGAAGAVAIHIRGRGMSGLTVAHAAQRVYDAAPSAQVLINDRADVAKATGAAGVHLPEEGLPIAAARGFLGTERWIGRSIHDPAAAAGALADGADYVFLGPIWPTPSHPGTPGLGAGVFEPGRGRPQLAIGGVTPERIAEVRRRGAYGVAAVRSLWLASDPGSVARAMLLSLEDEAYD